MDTLVVAGGPHRVHGVPVTASFARIVPLLAGEEVGVVIVGEFDFPGPGDDALVRTGGEHSIELSVAPGPYSRYVTTRAREGGVNWRADGPNGIHVEVQPQDGRRVLVWSDGALVALDTLTPP